MDVTPDDLVARYLQLSDEDLLDVARGYDSLTDEAQTTLRAEFARRKLEPPLLDEVPEPQASEALVTIRRFRDLSEAIVARSLLEASGIPVYLADENLVRLEWQISNFIGGIRLQVPNSDADAATELLDRGFTDAVEFEAGESFVQPHCPVCHSTDITFEGHARGAALTSLYLVGLPLPLGRATWLCHACDARWEDTEDENELPPAAEFGA